MYQNIEYTYAFIAFETFNYEARNKNSIDSKIYPPVWEIYTRSCLLLMMDEKRLRKNTAPSYLRTIHCTWKP